MKNSFVALNSRERARVLLDRGTAHELLDPFELMMSPHLVAQGLVPQSDDGVVLMRGSLMEQTLLVISLEGAFLGGGLGEVNGAKIAAALEKALQDNIAGHKVYPVVILDTGGVRLQEANYGLLVISEIQNMIVALRNYVPVIGIIPGHVGAFGGMSITAALMSYLIGTKMARIGLNGPEVIEQEAGVREFDASDKALVWQTIGVEQRVKTGIVDELVTDEVAAVVAATKRALTLADNEFRSRTGDFFLSLLATMDFSANLAPKIYAELFANHEKQLFEVKLTESGNHPQSQGRGYDWFAQLTGIENPTSPVGTILVADVMRTNGLARYFSVITNSDNALPRVRSGEMGLVEGYALAKYVLDAVALDHHNVVKRPLILVIDVPSQAYGYREELVGIHMALAASVDAYASARQAGHPVIGLIVGNAISGAFLAHGLQSNRLVAFNDKDVNVQAMSKASAARITLRTIVELEKASAQVPAMAYDINSFVQLGAIYSLMEDIDADHPNVKDAALVEAAIDAAILSLGDERHFEWRYTSDYAINGGRIATNAVRAYLDKAW